MYNNFCFENHAVCEIMWKHMLEPDRPQMAIRRMRCACCISEDTHTHSECEVVITFQQQHCLSECASMLRPYVLGLSCLNFSIHKVFFPVLLTSCFLVQKFSLRPVLRHQPAVLFFRCDIHINSRKIKTFAYFNTPLLERWDL
jgi:hypothetical protein